MAKKVVLEAEAEETDAVEEDAPKQTRTSARQKETEAWNEFMTVCGEAADPSLSAADRRRYGPKILKAMLAWHELMSERERRAAERRAKREEAAKRLLAKSKKEKG